MVDSRDIREHLVGRNRESTYRWMRFGIGLFSLLIIAIFFIHLLRTNIALRYRTLERTLYVMFWGAAIGVSVFAAIMNAYQHGGWLVSVGLVLVPVLLFTLLPIAQTFLALPELFHTDLVSGPPTLTLLLGALLIGTGTFIVGVGYARLTA